MKTAKLFTNGKSQAVRLPKDFRFDGDEVFVKKVSSGVLLIPKDFSLWDIWKRNLMKYDKPFMAERNQPEHQERPGLNEIFS
jgi:antitoxin VapB